MGRRRRRCQPRLQLHVLTRLLPPFPPPPASKQIWWNQVVHAWRHSPYFLKGEDEGTGARKKRKADFVESYRDAPAAGSSGGAAGAGGEAAACTLTMTLHPQYFPEELYTKQTRWAGGVWGWHWGWQLEFC